MKIGQVAEQAGVTIDTVRHAENACENGRCILTSAEASII